MNDKTGRRFGRWPWLGEHGHLEKARGRTKYNGRSVNQLQDPLEGGPRLSAAVTRNLAAQPRASGGGDAVSKGSVFCASSPRHSGPGVTGLCFCQRLAVLVRPGLRAPIVSRACAVGRVY